MNYIKDFFDNLKRFESTEDIPTLPIVSDTDYKDYIIPNLIRCGAIPKSRLKIGKVYEGSCRNAERAIWDGKVFWYERYKYGITYDESINHFEDDDGYDVFIPIKLV